MTGLKRFFYSRTEYTFVCKKNSGLMRIFAGQQAAVGRFFPGWRYIGWGRWKDEIGESS